MSEPFLAEIRMVGFNFPPRGWAFCDGQILPIEQNQSLYSLLGTTYGGDGRTSFALPDLRSRTPIHMGHSDYGTNYALGQRSGEEAHTLTQAEMPQHDHAFQVSDQNGTSAFTANISDHYYAVASSGAMMYGAPTANSYFNPVAVTNTGGSQPHNNMQPYLTVNFCIALQGTLPSRS